MSAHLVPRVFGTGNVLLIHRFTLDMLDGDHLAALFLEQLLYWTDRTRNKDGWIVKTYAEWETELRLSKYLVSRIVEMLKPFGVETTVRRSPFHKMNPVVHYRIDLSVLEVKIQAFIDSEKISLSNESENSSPSLSETTSETTESALPLEMDELPDHLTPAQRKVIQLPDVPRPQPDGGAAAFTITEAYLNEWNVVVKKFRDAIHRDDKKHAIRLAELGATPDEVAAMCRERRAKGHQMSDFPLAFAARDYVTWKMKQETAAPDMTDDQRAMRAAQLAADEAAWLAENRNWS